MPEKRDPYNSKEKWDKWSKESPIIPNTLKYNSDLILKFLRDFEIGKNTSKLAIKGERSPIRLMALKSRLSFFARQFDKKKFTSLNKDDVHILFKEMREGKIKRPDGKPYISTGSYVKDWKCFWNWLKKIGEVTEDINEDLSRVDGKPKWVYLNEEQFKLLLNHSSPDYRPLIALMLDVGCRVTEAFSIKVSDFQEDFNKLTIRGETSKNHYERTINLKLCRELIKEYVKFYQLKQEDFLFQKNPPAFNKYLRENVCKLFGDKVSHNKAGGKFSEMSLYDIRHIASTYWLKRYQTHRALMYRMGWTSERWIKYYSEFLGQNDEISDEDMLTTEDKSKLEKQQKEIIKLKTQVSSFGSKEEEYSEMFANIKKELESLKKAKKG